jgi:hypothetical protein
VSVVICLRSSILSEFPNFNSIKLTPNLHREFIISCVSLNNPLIFRNLKVSEWTFNTSSIDQFVIVWHPKKINK